MAARLPVGRVLPPISPELVEELGAAASERLMLVDFDRLRMTKSFAKLRKEALAWSDADLLERLASLMAEGPV